MKTQKQLYLLLWSRSEKKENLELAKKRKIVFLSKMKSYHIVNVIGSPQNEILTR